MFSTPPLSLPFVSMTSILNTYFNAVDSKDTKFISITPSDYFNHKWKVKIFLVQMYAFFPVVNAYDTSRVESVLPESWKSTRNSRLISNS